ncbi:hypothetical protein SELMODRAFT_406215 [Selaginella moellendorffii]|uniref:Uncharacterized protein n=1 Tax=Selaginella moellendorffii TaxID=88036 RepID=D8R1M7_SELML|nr:hypothetical protein SELMODRAFT_406215 [Selaginella moellendorffii]
MRVLLHVRSAIHVRASPTSPPPLPPVLACNMKSSAFATPDTLMQPFFNHTSYTTRFSGSLRSLASLQTRSTSHKAWTRSDMRDLECLPRSCGPLWSYDLVAAQNETTKVYDFQPPHQLLITVTNTGKMLIHWNPWFNGLAMSRSVLSSEANSSSTTSLWIHTSQHERNEGRCGSQGPLQLQGDPWRKLYQSCSDLGDSHFDLAVESFGDSVDMEWREGVSCGVGYIDVAGINLQKPSVAKDSELQQLQNKSQDCSTL